MMLTDYYKMRVLKSGKSLRFDCVCSTRSYAPFESRGSRTREKHLHLYFIEVPHKYSADAHRRAEYALTDGSPVSSVYIPDIRQPLKGYGDMVNTDDGLLFLFGVNHKELEIFVARGYKCNIHTLSSMFLVGELDDEIKVLRKRALSCGNTVEEQQLL